MTNFTHGHYARGTAAGQKGNTDTGRAASDHASGTLPRRHRQMMEAWAVYGAEGAIPETIANDLGLPVHVVRPRCGELVKRGLMFVVGKAPGNLGCHVRRFSIVRPAEVQAA